MKRNETKKAYVEPQIMMFALLGNAQSWLVVLL